MEETTNNTALTAAELTGSEKQIAWAEEIRTEKIKRLAIWASKAQEALDYYSNDDNMDKEIEILKKEQGMTYMQAVEHMTNELQKLKDYVDCYEKIIAIKSARWWIDNEYMLVVNAYIGDIKRDAEKQLEIEAKVQEAKEQAEEKAEILEILTPEEQKCDVVPIVMVEDDKVILQSEYSKAIINVMHDMAAKWDKPYWILKITDRTGSAIDRGAEMVHELLAAGIPVRVENDVVKEKALAADYQLRQTKWIDKVRGGKSVSISWGKKDDLYFEAKKLTGARYKDYKIIVPVSSYREILDFADLNGCTITDEAMEAIEAFKAAQVTVEIADAPIEETVSVEEKLKKQLEAGSEVIEDLLDD